MAERDWAVVIGAGALGTAVARQLAQRYPVLLADLDFGRAETQAVALRSDGAEVMAVGCDVTNTKSVDRLATFVKDHGGMRVLAHVAGLAPAMGAFDAITLVNLVGPTLVTEALLPCANPGAAAIMISSLGAHLSRFPEEVVDILRQYAGALDLSERLRRVIGDAQATPNVAYQLSKFGLLMLCRRQAARWAERQGRIVSLSPGIIATPMGGREFDTNPVKQRMYKMSPMKREGTMIEIAEVVDFLASDKASFITGTDILVDGGLSGAMSDVPFGGSPAERIPFS